MTEVWENLSKNQDDPEKIEEAITRNIGDHLDDPDAHVETGQSLQSHKASLVIDHLARSVVGDKINSLDDVLTPKEFCIITAKSGSYGSMTIEVDGKAWTTNELANRAMYFLTGDSAGEVHTIQSNTADTLGSEDTQPANIAVGDIFKITEMVFGPTISDAMINVLEVTALNDMRYEAFATDDYIEYTVECDKIAIIGEKGPNSGKHEIYIDGVSDEIVDAYSEANEYRVNLYEKAFETTAVRTIKIKRRSDKNASSGGYEMKITGFDRNGVVAFSSLPFLMASKVFSFTSNSNGYHAEGAFQAEGYQIFSMLGSYDSSRGDANKQSAKIQMYPDADNYLVEFYDCKPSTAYTIEVYFLIIKKDDPWEGYE